MIHDYSSRVLHSAPMSLPPGGHSAIPHRRTVTSVQALNRYSGDRDLVAPIPPPRPTRLRANNSANLSHQLDPSPQELPVKDTDSGVDLANAPCKYKLICEIMHLCVVCVIIFCCFSIPRAYFINY